GERREREVRGAADPALEHAAEERSATGALRGFERGLRGRGAAEASRLDVDDSARSERESGADRSESGEALVESDRRAEVLRELAVLGEVLGVERLLEEEEREGVEPLEDRPVLEPVGPV